MENEKDFDGSEASPAEAANVKQRVVFLNAKLRVGIDSEGWFHISDGYDGIALAPDEIGLLLNFLKGKAAKAGNAMVSPNQESIPNEAQGQEKNSTLEIEQ